MAIFLTLLLSVLVVAGLFYLLRMRHKSSPARSISAPPAQTGTLAHLQQNRSFWGAELSTPGCAESRALLGKPFPFEKAPELPLPGCEHTLATCNCVFRGLRDRRVTHRRLQEDRRGVIRFDKTHPDRRKNAGRRRGDRWVGHAL